MILDYKIISSVVGIIVTFFGYYYYIKDIYKGENKPHMYSWIIWGASLSIGFFIQFLHGGGWGSLVTFFEAFFCVSIALIAIKKGEKSISIMDKYSLILAFIAMFFWIVLKQPLISLILVIFIDFLGFLPTVKKAYKKPRQENISVYLAGVIVFSLAFIGLEKYSFLTYAYPLTIIILDGSMLTMILIRRKILK